MSGTEFGRGSGYSKGAWDWKRLETPFMDFLKSRREGAESENGNDDYLPDRWYGFDWDTAAEGYKRRMKANFGYIRLPGLPVSKSLGDLFPDVDILDMPQTLTGTGNGRYRLKSDMEKSGKSKRIPGYRIVAQKRGHRLFVLGGSGGGKTTFLKYLVHLTMVKDWGKIPIFITLKIWSDSGMDITKTIAREMDICGFPNALAFVEYILDAGKAVVLFDGLDEVDLENDLRSQIESELNNISKKYSNTQTIITSSLASDNDFFADFTHVEISEFTERQVESFAYLWFGRESPKAAKLLKEMHKHKFSGARDLHNPLLLSLFCLVYDESSRIPIHSVDLFEEALDILLKKWDDSRKSPREKTQPAKDEGYKNLPLHRKKQLFAYLSAEAFEKGEIYIHKNQLIRRIEAFFKRLPSVDSKEIDGEGILRDIETHHGILIQWVEGIYTFAHLTLQEYFTAKHVTSNRSALWDGLAKHMSTQRWEEVFLFATSLADEADELILKMVQTAGKELQADPTLVEIQEWVEQKAGTIQAHRPAALRCVYWILALDLVLALDRSRTLDHALNLARESTLDHGLIQTVSRDRARDLAFIHAREKSLALARERTFAFVKDCELFACAWDHARQLALDLDFASEIYLDPEGILDCDFDDAFPMVRDRDFTFNPLLVGQLDRELTSQLARAFDRELDQEFWSDLISPLTRETTQKIFFEKSLVDQLKVICMLALAVHLKDYQPVQDKFQTYRQLIQQYAQGQSEQLSEKISQLSIPKTGATKTIWQKFEKDTLTLITEYFEFNGDWNLSSEQLEKVMAYLNAQRFIMDCLEGALVHDREAILSKIMIVE